MTSYCSCVPRSSSVARGGSRRSMLTKRPRFGKVGSIYFVMSLGGLVGSDTPGITNTGDTFSVRYHCWR